MRSGKWLRPIVQLTPYLILGLCITWVIRTWLVPPTRIASAPMEAQPVMAVSRTGTPGNPARDQFVIVSRSGDLTMHYLNFQDFSNYGMFSACKPLSDPFSDTVDNPPFPVTNYWKMSLHDAKMHENPKLVPCQECVKALKAFIDADTDSSGIE